MDNNIIKILPKIYIGYDNMISQEYLNDNNITDIINVDLTDNDNIDNYIETNTNLRKINLNGIINYGNINEIICQIIKSNGSCIILSKNNSLGFLVVCGFLIDYIGMTLMESLSLSKKYNINISSSYNQRNIEELFNFYKSKNTII